MFTKMLSLIGSYRLRILCAFEPVRQKGLTVFCCSFVFGGDVFIVTLAVGLYGWQCLSCAAHPSGQNLTLSNTLVYDQNTCKTNDIPISLSCTLCL